MGSTIADHDSRLAGLLAEYRRRYPDALAACAQIGTQSRDAGYTWPDWCWLPMGGVIAYLATRGGPATGEEIGRVSALTAWRLTRGVFTPDAEVASHAAAQLRDTTGGGVSAWRSAALPELDVWARLPQFCCYLTWPDSLEEHHAGTTREVRSLRTGCSCTWSTI